MSNPAGTVLVCGGRDVGVGTGAAQDVGPGSGGGADARPGCAAPRAGWLVLHIEGALMSVGINTGSCSPVRSATMWTCRRPAGAEVAVGRLAQAPELDERVVFEAI